jgi:cation:H+ antiporter
MLFNIFIIIIGFILLIKGADFLVNGSSNIAKRFHISEIVIGLTIVSIGTSMPEFVISITSSINGLSDIAIGNVIGSNISNIFLILGSCALIRNLKIQRETKVFELPFNLIATILLLVFCINNFLGQENIISRTEGIILLIFFILFIIYNFIMAKKGEDFDNIKPKEANSNSNSQHLVKSFFYILLGIIGLKFGGDFVVNGAVEIATIFGISQQTISLTIVAFSTSLPELITSITATLKNESDMAIGNIIGSCLFNILLIAGASATLYPISYSTNYTKDIILLLFGSIFLTLLPFIGRKNEMTRLNGAFFLIIYFLYLASLVFL